jgi:hypothetical protein
MSVKYKLSAIIISIVSIGVSCTAFASEQFTLTAATQSQCTILDVGSHNINLSDKIFDVFGHVKQYSGDILSASAKVTCNAGSVTIGLKSEKGGLTGMTNTSNKIDYRAIADVPSINGLKVEIDTGAGTPVLENTKMIATGSPIENATIKIGIVTTQSDYVVLADTYSDVLTLVVSNYP